MGPGIHKTVPNIGADFPVLDHERCAACCGLLNRTCEMADIGFAPGYDGSLMGSINALPNYTRHYNLPEGGSVSTGIVFAIYQVGQMAGALFMWAADWSGRRMHIFIGVIGVCIGTIVISRQRRSTFLFLGDSCYLSLQLLHRRHHPCFSSRLRRPNTVVLWRECSTRYTIATGLDSRDVRGLWSAPASRPQRQSGLASSAVAANGLSGTRRLGNLVDTGVTTMVDCEGSPCGSSGLYCGVPRQRRCLTPARGFGDA
ncbi:hypothetical protein VTN31DRAFT_4043 [Thermomyces dupontii]|uniref:uncharacterized protein n=1 Tax=Talaromyces thermophilus TaxID=28565 RepID=UPI0037421555